LKYYPEIEICVKEQKGEQESKRKEAQRLEDENFGSHFFGRVRTYLWNLMEYPETSKQAQVIFQPWCHEQVICKQFIFVLRTVACSKTICIPDSII